MITLESCYLKYNELKEVIYWNNRVIEFDKSLKLKINGRDTLFENYPNDKFKILVSVGPNGCSECQLHLYAWKRMMDSLHYMHQKLDFIFVVYLNNYLNFELLEKQNKFYYPVFYDPHGLFFKQNNISIDKTVQVFLLNNKNEVLLIGDPLKNKKVLDLYMKLLL